MPSEIDTSAVPSVRARLAELKLQQSTSSVTPAIKRPPPPPPPTGTRAGVPALPARKGPPPPPPHDAEPFKPALPPRRATTAKPDVTAAAGLVPPLPERTKTAPALPTRRGSSVTAPQLPARKLPPPFTPTTPQLPTRATPPLPSRPSQDGSPKHMRSLPPPAPLNVPRSLPPAAVVRPPPIPTSTRPPPVPVSTRPSATALTPVQTGPTCLRHRDFSEADFHAAQAHPTHSLRALAHSLTSPFPSHTDKARVLFTYLHHTVAYDFAGFSGQRPMGKQDALSVLKTGLSVCQGYAALFLALAEQAGMEAALVGGHGKGFGYSAGSALSWPPSGHAWNAVRIDGGEWWLLDACWGAGYVEAGKGYTKKFNAEMFVSTPEEFGRRHFPSEKKWNLGGRGWEDYQYPPEEREGKGPQLFGCWQEELGFSDRPECVGPRRLVDGGMVEFWAVKKPCKCLPYEGNPEEEFLMFLNVGEGFDKSNWALMEQRADGRTWGAEAHVPRGTTKVTMHYVISFDGRPGKGLTAREFLSKVGRVGWAWGSAAEWKME